MVRIIRFSVCVLINILMQCVSTAQSIVTVAGQGTSFADGIPATASKFSNPSVLASDKWGNLYFSNVSDHKLRKIDTAGFITTIAGIGGPGLAGDGGSAKLAKLNQPAGIAIDSVGNVFFADGANHRIRKIDVSTGVISTVIGSTSGFSGDGGPASAALLRLPSGLCFDKYGVLYIGDCGNGRIRKVGADGRINTIAGTGLPGWGGDGGPATAARCLPWNGICTDNFGNLYFSEWSWGVVRKIDVAGIITTIAGDTTTPHIYNGDNIPATIARIDPCSIVVDKDGVVFLTDSYNHRIRKVGTDGIVQTVAGNGTGSNTGDFGPATNATVHTPGGITLDTCGNLYFGQTGTPRIRKIEFNPLCTSVADIEKTKLFTHDFSVFPNPATTTLTLSSPYDVVTVAIYNLVGETVYTAKHTGIRRAEIPIGHLPPGMYLIKVNERWVQRFMKE